MPRQKTSRTHPKKALRPVDKRLLRQISKYEEALDKAIGKDAPQDALDIAHRRFRKLKSLVREHEIPLLENDEGLKVLKELTQDNQRHLLTPERTAGLLEEIKQLSGQQAMDAVTTVDEIAQKAPDALTPAISAEKEVVATVETVAKSEAANPVLSALSTSSTHNPVKPSSKAAWIVGGLAVAAVGIGAFMSMGRNQNHAGRENNRNNQLGSTQGLV